MNADYGLIYLATPYTKYHKGINAAFIDAAKVTGGLIKKGLLVYSPIVHTHPAAIYGGLDPLDMGIWTAFDDAMLERCDTLFVATMPGWIESSGVAHEINVMSAANKPMFKVDPETLEVTR